jgi:hypothetical protein
MRFKVSFAMILLFATFHLAKAQNDPLRIPARKMIDTAFTYKWLKEDVVKIGLEDLLSSRDKLHFRFWCRYQFVEIWARNRNTYFGELISYTSKYDPNAYSNPEKKEKIFTKHNAIDTVLARQIYERAMDIAVFEIVAQEKIQGWREGTDGYRVSLEYSDPLRYSMKYYWSPASQVAVPEAKSINEFEAFLETNLGLREKWKTFIEGLPKGCYHTGGLAVVCTGRKEARRLRKSN